MCILSVSFVVFVARELNKKFGSTAAFSYELAEHIMNWLILSKVNEAISAGTPFDKNDPVFERSLYQFLKSDVPALIARFMRFVELVCIIEHGRVVTKETALKISSESVLLYNYFLGRKPASLSEKYVEHVITAFQLNHKYVQEAMGIFVNWSQVRTEDLLIIEAQNIRDHGLSPSEARIAAYDKIPALMSLERQKKEFMKTLEIGMLLKKEKEKACMELLSRMQRWEGVIVRLLPFLVLIIGVVSAIALEDLVHETWTMSKILSWVFLFSTMLVAPILLTRARTSFLSDKMKESFSQMTTAKQVSTAFEDLEFHLSHFDCAIQLLYSLMVFALVACRLVSNSDAFCITEITFVGTLLALRVAVAA